MPEDAPLENTPPIQTPEIVPPQDPNALKQIRTFQGDVAEALQKQKSSLYSIQQAERARKEQAQKMHVGGRVAPVETEDPKNFKRGILFFVGTLLCLALAGGIGFYAFKEYKKKTALPVIVVPQNRLIAFDTSTKLNTESLDRDSLIEAVHNARNADIKGVSSIELNNVQGEITNPLTASELLVLLRTQAPGNLMRALDPVFMLGTLEGTPRHTFLLFKLDSFENAYAGMLTWESALYEDFLPLFATKEQIASTSPTAKFADLTIQNRDTRVLRDDSGNILFIYAFFENEVLILTDSEASLKSLVQKLSAEKLVQ